jgi:predicted RNA binding protein YcfA (HicA-like mRNA interferase family)
VAEGFYRAVTEELKRLGYRHAANAKGSHEKWANDAGRTLIVPRSMKSRHTANGILRDAGSELHL